MIEVDRDTWIFDAEPARCIEHYHEDEPCFGRAPGGSGDHGNHTEDIEENEDTEEQR